jgi:hypothetical protein
MEFTILNQLMNLVRGNLREDSSKSPHTGTGSKTHGTFTRHGAPRSSIRGGGTELGHSAGAYARMDDDGSAGRGIKLQNLKAGDVLKTTTTEVRVDKIDKIDEESVASPAKARSSSSSSEVYIIEHHSKAAV